MFLRQIINRLNKRSLVLAILFYGFIFSFLFSNSTYADDAITVTVSGNPTITVAPSTEGTFAESSNVNVSVTSSATSGYTLAITANNGTSLIGTTDSTKSIASINSPLSAQAFNSSTYNNQWGYKPSMHYNTSTGQRASNTNFLPSPTASGDIIDIVNDSSSNNYTLSIGTRVTNTIGFQSYENTFVITAVGNIVQCDSTKLCIQYEGNGLTYDGETLNRVNYNSTTTSQQVTKILHSDNVGDDGIATGNSAVNTDQTKETTIDGASSVNVSLYYDTEGVSYDWVALYAGADSVPSSANDGTIGSNGNLTGKLGGNKSGYTTSYTTWNLWNNSGNAINSDTIKIHFKTDSAAGSYISYGYYAIITGTSTTYERSVSSGEYATPTGTNAIFHGWSTTQTTPGGGLPSDVEYADNSEILAKMPGDEGETKTLYAVWQQGQAITFTKDSNVTKIDVLDASGATVGTITSSGQSLVLAQGDTYTIKPTHATGYTTNTITKTSGAGTLSGKNFTVGAGSATLSVTSKTLSPIQNFNCSSLASGSTEEVYDTRDNEVYLIGKLADNKCWMLDNLRLDPTAVSLADLQGKTNASNTTLGYLKNGGGTSPYTTTAVSNAWTSSSQESFNLPYINAASKDATVTSYGSGSGKVGVYYNYCAASAGSYCYASYAGTGNASEDLCPAGWRMPTSSSSGEYQALYAAYSSDATNFRNALSTPLSGYFNSGSAGYQGTYGYFWSSTYSAGNYMYLLLVNSSYVRPSSGGSRYSGYSLRCILSS